LEVRRLGALDDGEIGLSVGNNSDGDFVNLRIADEVTPDEACIAERFWLPTNKATVIETAAFSCFLSRS
jgi:hypothetical protein